MGYDRGRRRGRDKRDGFGEDSFDPFGGGDGFPPPQDFGNDREIASVEAAVAATRAEEASTACLRK